MTTQSAGYREASDPSARATSNDGRSTTGSTDGAIPEMKARLQHMVDSGKSRVSGWNDDIHDGIREKPIQSVLIAAAAGAVIGALVSGLIVGRSNR